MQPMKQATDKKKGKKRGRGDRPPAHQSPIVVGIVRDPVSKPKVIIRKDIKCPIYIPWFYSYYRYVERFSADRWYDFVRCGKMAASLTISIATRGSISASEPPLYPLIKSQLPKRKCSTARNHSPTYVPHIFLRAFL